MNFDIPQITSMLNDQYQLDITSVKQLAGERDYNFLCTSSQKQNFLLKIYHVETSEQELDFQWKITQHLQGKNIAFASPYVVQNKDNERTSRVILNNKQFSYRIHSWVNGKLLGDMTYHSPDILYQWGNLAGIMSSALQDFDHDFAHRYYKWDPRNTLDSRPLMKYFSKKEEIETAKFFWELFERETLPKLKTLRRSVNHNDLHEMNTLVETSNFNATITGIIDFGDAVYTQTINELAIACAYAMMHKPFPIDAAVHLIKGYHSAYKIEEAELEVLLSLITARLLITVSSSAENAVFEPENAYLQVSNKAAWKLLFQLREVDPNYALYRFRETCGYLPVPNHKDFVESILQGKFDIHPVISISGNVKNIDLGMNSDVLGNSSNYIQVDKFSRRVFRHMEDNDIDLAIGGYGEIRPFYTTDAYKVQGNEGAQWRTVHLGMDFWAPTQRIVDKQFIRTEVFAATKGKVYSVHNNDAECDYGPTIILEHKYDKNLTFFTLYGHLSLDSLEKVHVGQEIQGGECIGYLGKAKENGGWPPHLHFQIILDLLGNTIDFPGVCYSHEMETWKSICPDPALFFSNLPNAKPKNCNSAKEIIEARNSLLGKGLSISYTNPLHIVRGYMQHLYDETGRRFLDTVNNVAHVGHENESVVASAKNQIEKLNTNTRYLHAAITDYASELLETFPEELNRVYFVNSGSEANELALRIAKTVTKASHIAAIEVGYHGNTGGTINVSSYKFDGKGGTGKPNFTSLMPIPDVYRGKHSDSISPGNDYASYIHEIVQKIEQSDEKLAGFICESILSCGGQVMLPDTYLETVYKAVRKAGGLCIADEVQVGFGRVGETFWGFELSGVVPDIVTLGKPIGNGHPLAAVVTKKSISEQFANGMEYFNTFGGNPVSCAIGREVLKVIKRDKLQANASKVGNYLQRSLKELQADHKIIGDVRGIGFFQGIELVRNIETKEPADKETSYIADRMRERGILMSVDGPFHNVLKIKPPMCFTEDDAEFLVHEIRSVLQELKFFTN